MNPAYFLIFALQCLFPIFETAADEYVGISIVNTDTQLRDFTVTATAANGSRLQAGLLTLNPASQRAFLLQEVVGPGAPSPGWIRIGSNASGCTSYMASGADQVLAGTDANESGSTVMWVPHISVNTGFTELAHTDTLISIVNTGTVTASINAQLMGLDGLTKGTLSISVPPNGSRIDRISELFAAVLPNNSLGGKTFEGYARLSADVLISVWQRIDTPLSRSMVRGISIPSQTSSAVLPHFVIGGGFGFDSILNIVNPGPVGANSLELRAFDDLGNAIGETVRLTLRNGEGRRVSVAELFKIVTILTFPPPLVSGYILIQQLPTAQPAATSLIAALEIFARESLGKTASMLYSASYSNATRWTIPFATSSAPFFSGYAIANVTQVAAQADVAVEVFNSAGSVVDRRVLSISPGRRETGVIPSRLSSGYIRFTSNLPVYVTGTIGTTYEAIGSAAGASALALSIFVEESFPFLDKPKLSYEGQTFRMHFHPSSQINVFNLRPGRLTFVCGEPATDDCPANSRRLWADGDMPAN